MATAKSPDKVFLFLAIMFNDEQVRDTVLAEFSNRYGNILEKCDKKIIFSDISKYYDKEIGGEVYKEYFVFEELIDREKLSLIKNFTNSLEEKYSVYGNRIVNLDPGYITPHKFVLASAKDFAHRIYIGNGIYAEVTLHFKKDRVKFFSWTYQDYLDTTISEFLLKYRAKL